MHPLINERGPIAETYEKLQGVHILRAARKTELVSKASIGSMLLAILQSAEIALLNLTDLENRATTDIEHGEIGPAAVKLGWAHGFQRIMVRLSLMSHKLNYLYDDNVVQSSIRISDSPAFNSYVAALKRFDNALIERIESGDLLDRQILMQKSIDNVEFNLLHLARVCSHESTIWDKHLSELSLSTFVPSYEELIKPLLLRQAVYDIELSGDTYITQFRALHQIPEILTLEMNDRLEQVILSVRSENLRAAVEHLINANLFGDGIVACLDTMVDNLSTSQYHEIRENLGLTSGMHSTAIHYHLFTDLYTQLGEEVVNYITGYPAQTCQNSVLINSINQIQQNRFHNSDAWEINLLIEECIKFRDLIDHWRNLHLHLPRNNLGGPHVKSLTGSLDAVGAVKRLKNNASQHDPLRFLTGVRNASNLSPAKHLSSLATYLNSDDSLDHHILESTGEITLDRFQNVQGRSGPFAHRCPFVKPPKRQV